VPELQESLDAWLSANGSRLVEWRRDLHAHPELAFNEKRTTDLIERELAGLGLSPKVLPHGTGLICEVGDGPGPVVALRADIDALPLADLKDVPYRSLVDGTAHACGHDAHTAILLGAASVLAGLDLPGRVRLLFQPAEEQLPGGSSSVIAAGGLDEVGQIFALHADPGVEVGQIGLRSGAITAACDALEVALFGPGGHTARPQLTVDLVHTVGTVITQLPALLARRVDPRAGLSLVWGAVQAGRAPNAIPGSGVLRGTLRVLDRDVWHDAEPLVRQLVEHITATSGARVELGYSRGVPPVVNDPECVALQRAAVTAALGPNAVTASRQSMGGEDFAWYLERVPGALARLGVRPPGMPRYDLHQGGFDIDERSLAIGVRYTVALALQAATALRQDARTV
jgi:amidohydrolase